MKHIYYAIPFALITTAALMADSCDTAISPYFSARSMSVNLPRMRSGWTHHTHQLGMNDFNAALSIGGGYSRSFRSNKIAHCLFGNSLKSDSCPEIHISGSRVVDDSFDRKSLRGDCDWLADYFGLGEEYQGSISFEPRVSQGFIDFAVHIGLDGWKEGLWFCAWSPFVHSKWDLNFCENKTSTAASTYLENYFTVDAVNSENTLSNALDFFQKGLTPNLGDGFIFEPLRSCRWGDSRCDFNTYLVKNGFADLRFTLGYDFYHNEKYLLGLGITGAAPTGTRPQACNLFEPVIGNGKHWELGAAWVSAMRFWESEDSSKYGTLHIDANITHLFKAHQMRCFDLCNKPLSRYMLATKMEAPVNQLWTGPENDTPIADLEQPIAQFKNVYTPVANLTCADVNVSVGVQVDLNIMLNATWNNFAMDLGYNLWARSCEKIKLRNSCLPRIAEERNTWALKGDTRSFARGAGNAPTEDLQGVPVALSATQSFATIFTGGNLCCGGINPGMEQQENGNANRDRNPAIDNAAWTWISPIDQQTQNELDVLVIDAESETTPNKRVFTSKEPKFINVCDLDFDAARTKAVSHSIFLHLSYQWLDKETHAPYIGVGAQGEFAQSSSRDCKQDCPSACRFIQCTSDNNPATISTEDCTTKNCCRSCPRCSLSQWSVWIKGGVSFH